MPRSFYGRGKADDERVIFISQRGAIPSEKQVWKHLLCEDCEDRLNKNGERWMARQALQLDGSFPLLESLQRNSFEGEQRNGWPVRFPAGCFGSMNARKIAYFAASIFWRRTYDGWTVAAALRSEAGRYRALEFGPYAEKIRRFLLDEEPWPSGATLRVVVVDSCDPFLMQVIFPLGGRERETRAFAYSFYVPGVRFDLFLDKRMRSANDCFVSGPGNPVFLGQRDVLEDLVRLVLTGTNL